MSAGRTSMSQLTKAQPNHAGGSVGEGRVPPFSRRFPLGNVSLKDPQDDMVFFLGRGGPGIL